MEFDNEIECILKDGVVMWLQIAFSRSVFIYTSVQAAKALVRLRGRTNSIKALTARICIVLSFTQP